MLSDDSEFWSDGGGKVSAVIVVMKDKLKIAHFFNWLGSTGIFRSENYKAEAAIVNGMPGFSISRQLPTGLWEFESLISAEIVGDRISKIYSQRNPEKLNALVKFNTGI